LELEAIPRRGGGRRDQVQEADRIEARFRESRERVGEPRPSDRQEDAHSARGPGVAARHERAGELVRGQRDAERAPADRLEELHRLRAGNPEYVLDSGRFEPPYGASPRRAHRTCATASGEPEREPSPVRRRPFRTFRPRTSKVPAAAGHGSRAWNTG